MSSLLNRTPGKTVLPLLLAFAAGGFHPRPAGAAAKPAPPPTVTVERGLLRVIIRATGVVEARSEMPIQARAAGEITSLTVKIGQPVKKGQLLLAIDPSEYERRLKSAQADLSEAKARLQIALARLDSIQAEFEKKFAEAKSALDKAKENLDQAEAAFKRIERLQKDKRAGAKELRDARDNLANARKRYEAARGQMDSLAETSKTLELQRLEVAARRAAVQRAETAVENARAQIAKTRLVSPIDGTVTEITVRKGQVVAPATVEVGIALLTISDLSKIAVSAEIGESDIRDIQPNLAAMVSIPAFPERKFQGRIVSISPTGKKRGSKVVFPIRIELEGEPGDAARPGLSANVQIVAIEKPNVLLLDNRAIRWVGREPRALVLVQDKTVERTLKLGRSDGTRTEVLGGLREGEKVVLPQPPAPPKPKP